MTATTTTIERSGPAIRATLAEFTPDESEQFEAQFQQAVKQAGEQFDLTPVDAMAGDRAQSVQRHAPATQRQIDARIKELLEQADGASEAYDAGMAQFGLTACGPRAATSSRCG